MHINIPFPIHPDEENLPRSIMQFQLPSGQVASLSGVPIQGPKTLDMLIQILNVWKPAIVKPDPPDYTI